MNSETDTCNDVFFLIAASELVAAGVPVYASEPDHQQIGTDDILSGTEVVDDMTINAEEDDDFKIHDEYIDGDTEEDIEDAGLLQSVINASGTINASTLKDNDILMLDGDTTLVMNVERTLMFIWGSHDLIVDGTHQLRYHYP